MCVVLMNKRIPTTDLGGARLMAQEGSCSPQAMER